MFNRQLLQNKPFGSRKILLEVIFGVLFGFSSAASAQGLEVQTFGIGEKTILHIKSKLSGQQNSKYRQWSRKDGYFGAFAVHSDNVHTFGTANMHGLQAARELAVWGCEEWAEQNGVKSGTCSLYASKIPKTMDPRTSDASGLSERSLKTFEGEYRKNQRKGLWGAFAITSLAEDGFAFRFSTKAEAIGAAIAKCEAAATSHLPSKSNKFRQYIKRNELHDCKIVHVTGP